MIPVNDKDRYMPYAAGTGSGQTASLGNAKVATAAPTDANLNNQTVTVYLNEAGNKLMFRIKYSDGTLKSGEIALT